MRAALRRKPQRVRDRGFDLHDPGPIELIATPEPETSARARREDAREDGPAAAAPAHDSAPAAAPATTQPAPRPWRRYVLAALALGAAYCAGRASNGERVTYGGGGGVSREEVYAIAEDVCDAMITERLNE